MLVKATPHGGDAFELVNWSVKRHFWTPKTVLAKGQIINISGQDINQNIMVLISFYDAKGNYVTYDAGFILGPTGANTLRVFKFPCITLTPVREATIEFRIPFDQKLPVFIEEKYKRIRVR